MRNSKKVLATILSVCVSVSAFTSAFVLPSITASAEAAPESKIIYDFTDKEKFTAGAVIDQLPDAVRVTATYSSGGAVGGKYALMNIKSNETDIGLGANAQYLMIGDDFTTSFKANSMGFIDFQNPSDKVINNSDDTQTFVSYPATKVSVDVRLPSGTSKKGGFAMSKGYRPYAYNSVTGTYDSGMSFEFYSLYTDANGVWLSLCHSGLATTTTVENGKISNTNLNSYSLDQYPYSYGGDVTTKDTNTFGTLAVDENGNALSSDLVTVIDNFIKSKTVLTDSDYWVNIENSAQTVDNAQRLKSVITFNFSGYDELKANNPGLPDKLKIIIPAKFLNTGKATGFTGLSYNGTANSTTPYFSAIGMMAGNAQNYFGGAIANVTVDYDTSAYYAEAAATSKTELLSDYNSLVLNSVLKQDNLTAINALLDTYNALPEGTKNILAEDEEVQQKLSTLSAAKAALDGGAYMFDTFEGSLNWEVKSKIDVLEKDVGGVVGDYSDNLTPTNVYSAAAASNAGDADGNAFWGINTDESNEYNNSLWLRKSFNEYNMNPTNAGNVQGWPSVLYTLKDGILPTGAKIDKVTGKMYLNNFGYGGAAYKQSSGVVFNYINEFQWNAAVLTGKNICKYAKQNASGGFLDANNGLFAEDGETRLNFTDVFKFDQWMDFTLQYDTVNSVYTMTVSGVDSSGVSHTFTGYTAAADSNGRTGVLGLVYGAPCMQAFDDIAVTLSDEEVPFVNNPKCLGAKILKQATATGDQNLRIDFDFSEAKLSTKTITEYGAILQAGTQTKAVLTDSENDKRVVLSLPVASASEMRDIYTVTITNSAENAGKRVSAVGYVKDSDGNIYYSENNSGSVVSDGLAVKSVMGVMKAWYMDMETTQATDIAAAADAYIAALSPAGLDAATAISKASSYASGEVTTTDASYQECREILSKVFHYFFNH